MEKAFAVNSARMHSQRYSAFISYRHLPRDRHWAIRIMRKLEAFRTPTALRAEGFPARIGTIFRDEDEIPSSTDLSDQIREALRHSDFLLVICTPDTPSSRWVGREIELFHELGKGDKIFPVLVDGSPDTSYPPGLLRRRRERTDPDGRTEAYWEPIEPIAADVRPREDESLSKTEGRALLRLAAALLGCRFDDLARREQQRRRFRRMVAVSSVALSLASLALGSLWYWDAYVRTKTSWFIAYGERWGVPLGIGQLDEAAAGTHPFVYRIKSRSGRVVEMVRHNGSSGLIGEAETPSGDDDWTKNTARWLYRYREDGTLARIMHEGGIFVTAVARNGRFT